MKRFQSRIESLRRIRQQAEQLARLTAAVRQGEKAAATKKVDELRTQIFSMQQQGANELANGNASLIQAMSAATSRLQSDLVEARTRETEADKRLLAAIQEVASAKSEVQIADKHRDREFVEHRRKTLIHEENIRQENNGQRFARKPTNQTTLPKAADSGVAQ